MAFEIKKLDVRGNYIDGKFSNPIDPVGEFTLVSPADLSDVVGKFKYSYSDIDRVVESANWAFLKWKKTPQIKRNEILKKYQDALKRRTDDLAQVISREMGKPLWESKSEVATMINKVDVTIQDSLPLVQERVIENIFPKTGGHTRYKPLGVMVVVGPFNFPGHLPNGHIVPALLTGNTVIFKPSEKTPMTGQIMAECMDEAGIPNGVFNLLQGDRETSRRLCLHEGVAGVLFTGSYEVGMRIKQDTLTQHWKLLALEMGGKNAALICEDANLELAIQETLIGAYITTGQRCSCTSRVLIHESKMEEFLKEFHRRAKAFKIGHPLEEGVFMGPIIDSASMDRYMKFHGIATREGAEVLMRGKEFTASHRGHYVTPTIVRFPPIDLEQAKKSVYLQTELFAPSVAFVPFREIEEAIDFANATHYGLVASVFTSNPKTYSRIYEDLEVGLVNWNRTTVGASSRLPFGGVKKSGNHFPTAVTATNYCTYPVASLESPDATAAEKAPYPGLNW